MIQQTYYEACPEIVETDMKHAEKCGRMISPNDVIAGREYVSAI